MTLLIIDSFKFVAAGGELWTPAEISTVLWLDASDSSTITTVSDKVSEWRDKSGNGRDATQASASLRPLLVSDAYAGNPAIRGDGVATNLPINPFSVSAGIRAYGVVSSLENTKRNGDWLCMTDLATPSPHYGGDPGRQDWYCNFFSNARPAINTGNIPHDSLRLAYIEQTGTALKGRVFGHFDETIVSASFDPSPTLNFKIFSDEAGYYGRHDIGEIVFVQSPSQDVSDKVEGYLSHKWGLASFLPVDHPFKTAAPTL